MNFYLYKNIGCYQDDQIIETIFDHDDLDKTEITKFTGEEIDELLQKSGIVKTEAKKDEL